MTNIKTPEANPANLQELLPLFRSPPTAPRSLLVSFEGIEGAGKTTQIQKLSQFLQQQNLTTHVLREPGGTPFGEKLRDVILGQVTPLHPLAELFLFASARTQLLQEKILPLLQTPDTVVILDRFIDSSLVYQGIAKGLGLSTVLSIHSHGPLIYVPHLTFYLQIPVEVSSQRLSSRGSKRDYFETHGEAFFKLLIEGMDQVANLFPKRIFPIKADLTQEETFDQMIKVWHKFSHDRS